MVSSSNLKHPSNLAQKSDRTKKIAKVVDADGKLSNNLCLVQSWNQKPSKSHSESSECRMFSKLKTCLVICDIMAPPATKVPLLVLKVKS